MATAAGPEQLQALREAIQDLDLAVHGDVIAEARALHDRLDAVICAAEAVYTTAGLAEVEGFADTAAFARHRCAMSLPRSRRVARRAARVAAWPELGSAWRDGRVTGAQVELAASLVPDRHVERFAATIGETLEVLGPLTASQTGTVLRHWVSAADDAERREAADAGVQPSAVVPERELSASRVGDELALRGFLDADSAAPVEKALEAATRDDLPGERRTPKQRRAVLTRDQGCRGCGADPGRCDIHHVVPWDRGGCTDIDNAVALCRRCHRMLHRHRWKDEIEPDGTYTITLPDGTTRATRPPGLDPGLPLLPVATSAEPARPVDAAPPASRRPRCNCPCLEHRSPTEEIEHQRIRSIVLERIRREPTPTG